MNRFFTHLGGLSIGLVFAASAGAHGAAAHGTPSGPVSADVTASDCWIRQIPAPAPSGGFLVFHNAGGQAAALTAASSPDYGDVMMHRTTEENGMSRMSMVDQVTVPAGGDLAFKPGSYHLMLEKPRDGLKIGDHVRVDFALGNGQRVQASCEIKSPKAMPAGMSGMSGHGGHSMKH
ncbi:MAG TPA: copper chaperone PCu(A)C [Castellaniella sp.]|jgi:copper(I)-binding protein|nr:copper chaperone PCu(A)C [Castellaniella sp.]